VLAAVIGAGAVGVRVGRQLISDGADVLIQDTDGKRAVDVVASLGDRATMVPFTVALPDATEVVVMCGPAGTQSTRARDLIDRGVALVSVGEDLEETRRFLELDDLARDRGVPVVLGCGFSPGLSCVLARHGAATMDRVDEIHVSRSGTGGPACARQHHRALGQTSLDWRDGAWMERPSASGRELNWFPDPIGAMDCYRAALPDPLLLLPEFDGIKRITARVAANRRNRLTARLPMLRPPHEDGGPGGVRVELRGWRGEESVVQVLGAMDRPATAAAAVAALTAELAVQGQLRGPGVAGLAGMVEPVPFLTALARRGVRAAVFEGAGADA
jgi:hypothetical protein